MGTCSVTADSGTFVNAMFIDDSLVNSRENAFDCGDYVAINNRVFDAEDYDCATTTEITAGANVTIQNNSKVRLEAPLVQLRPPFNFPNLKP